MDFLLEFLLALIVILLYAILNCLQKIHDLVKTEFYLLTAPSSPPPGWLARAVHGVNQD